jgi:hypothetical protein
LEGYRNFKAIKGKYLPAEQFTLPDKHSYVSLLHDKKSSDSNNKEEINFFFDATAPIGPGPPHSRGF